jgi:hypothetical protein
MVIPAHGKGGAGCASSPDDVRRAFTWAQSPPVTERVAKLQHTWIALKPGQYTDVQDALSTAGISDIAGKYEVRAVCTAPNFTPERKQDLRVGEIDTPKGQYRSEAVKSRCRNSGEGKCWNDPRALL